MRRRKINPSVGRGHNQPRLNHPGWAWPDKSARLPSLDLQISWTTVSSTILVISLKPNTSAYSRRYFLPLWPYSRSSAPIMIRGNKSLQKLVSITRQSKNIVDMDRRSGNNGPSALRRQHQQKQLIIAVQPMLISRDWTKSTSFWALKMKPLVETANSGPAGFSETSGSENHFLSNVQVGTLHHTTLKTEKEGISP